MKSLQVYILEKVKDLPESVKGLIVFDIDDTILKVDSSLMKVYKKNPDESLSHETAQKPGEQEIALTTREFAKDPDAEDQEKRKWFDYRDFKDPVKVYNSIITGTPLIKNLKIMDDYIRAGYDFCFLTARSCEEVIKKAISDFLKFRDKDGALKELGYSFKTTFSHAVNDEIKKYPGKDDAQKKANVLMS